MPGGVRLWEVILACFRAARCSFCLHSLPFAHGWSFLFLLVTLDSYRDRLQSWGLTWEAVVTGKGSGLTSAHTRESQELALPASSALLSPAFQFSEQDPWDRVRHFMGFTEAGLGC